MHAKTHYNLAVMSKRKQSGLLDRNVDWITGSTFKCISPATSSQSEQWTGHMLVPASTMAYYTISAVTMIVALLKKGGCSVMLYTTFSTFKIRTHAERVTG